MTYLIALYLPRLICNEPHTVFFGMQTVPDVHLTVLPALLLNVTCSEKAMAKPVISNLVGTHDR